jgi:hypothetical protein
VISAFRDVTQTVEEMKASDLLKKPFKLQELVGLARRYCPARAEVC